MSEMEMKHFLYDYKNANTLGKLYFLPKIHKNLFKMPDYPVISNSDTPTKKKTSEFLDHFLKQVIQSSWSHVKDQGDFLRKTKQIKNMPENSILFTANAVGLYSIKMHKHDVKLQKNAVVDFQLIKKKQ